MTDDLFEIEGSYPELERSETGLYSFDHAVGNPYAKDWGLLLRSQVELYGPPECGKSSLSYYLASVVKPDGKILLVSFELTDLDYIREILRGSGFTGKLEVVQFKDGDKWIGHSKLLTDVVNRVGREEDISVLIIDSIASIVPPAREDNQIGEGYGTDRAKFVNDMCGRLEAKMMNRNTPALFIALNHAHDSLDAWKFEKVTPGGLGLKYHSATRLYISRKEVFKDKDTGLMKGFVAKGKAAKLRVGGEGRKFVIYIVPGRGVHSGMTAVFDTINLGIANRTSTGYVKLQGESQGRRIGTLVDAAYDGDDEAFEPFFDALDDFNPRLVARRNELNSLLKADLEEKADEMGVMPEEGSGTGGAILKDDLIDAIQEAEDEE